jgi:hypothetical protein
MRTVHETEALRPSDPVPKSHSSAPQRFQRLKLTMKTTQQNQNGDPYDQYPESEDDRKDIALTSEEPYEPYPTDLHFTDDETALEPHALFRLLRRKVHWAEQERIELEAEMADLEERRKEEWQAKELVLLNNIEGDKARLERRINNLPGAADAILGKPFGDLEDDELPWHGGEPWWRQKDEKLNANTASYVSVAVEE